MITHNHYSSAICWTQLSSFDERNFMESLLTQPIVRPTPPPPPSVPGSEAPDRPVKSVPRRQVLHQVLCVAQYHSHAKEIIYEDKPVKKFSEKSGDQELEGEMVVLHLGRYCVQNPDISFIIFKQHQCVQGERPSKRQLESEYRRFPIADTQISPRAERMVIPPGVLQKAVVKVALYDPPRPGYQNHITGVDEKMIDMDAPYLFLYHHRAALRKLSEERSDPMTEHVLGLLEFIDSDWGAEYREADNQFDSGIVTNKHIDKLFCPNNIVIEKSKETVRAYVIATWPHRPRETFLWIPCWSWIYNGINLQRDHTVLQLPLPLPDSSTIADMPIRPISKTDNTIIEELRMRGKMFWAMKERYFGCYSGFDIEKTKNHQHTRVVIDIQTYSRMHPREHARDTSPRRGDASRIGQWPVSIPWEDDLDDLTVILLPTVVYGFWLQEKRWLQLDVGGIHPIEWNKRAFDRLVLDSKTKELITALVQVRIATGRVEDIIEGKGNGLMILLHGGPGTGKTLTAESVAEIAEKPLYRVTCGDVGTKVADVERYLQTVLYLGKTWNCVLLLDEADVFLEERGIADLERNSLVSVFLRILEYYDGILIMTSNRVGIFDEAFKSRIQVSLHYEDLSKSSRRTIWNNFIVMLEEAGADVNVSELESHLDDLASEELNGRQIRNAMTTARQLAVYRKERLDWEHLDQVLKTARDFNRYLKTVQGHTDKQWAREQRLR
ncbi:P-loop containing nucleoside triphosphate hydrolase protein [Hyaloscypha bicolor E]|uniref:P-loop containing nucleoside triphosphate hydrolase protein n=1 Tax=Hyaloscypha bicolor E TaxID=1095630 RepID=A0A2J6TC16_9HELO|nr:P-loop containing nucleoside triphosphate hydrolase protein [Hyaloscypha bicolor E]PMD60574.1 P-loop containing nucleoside triphosphate hydrolase protein [Hyaloscypha bicolor E]